MLLGIHCLWESATCRRQWLRTALQAAELNLMANVPAVRLDGARKTLRRVLSCDLQRSTAAEPDTSSDCGASVEPSVCAGASGAAS